MFLNNTSCYTKTRFDEFIDLNFDYIYSIIFYKYKKISLLER